jgi:UDP-2,4-diacetamido-2,4,6-trideoxy-beta-L-altropyranose hydrolase
MRIVIRTDSSAEIGTGHVMRCLTLAEALRGRDAEVIFISRDLPGNVCVAIESRGFEVYRLPSDDNDACDGLKGYARWLTVAEEIDAAQTTSVIESHAATPDWLIVDHYALGRAWERKLRGRTAHIMVVDDLADREHDCDVLLDQNLYENYEHRYDGLVPSGCIVLAGPQFAMLREEFAKARAGLRTRDGAVRRVFVFFGGSDLTGETEKAIATARQLNRPDIHFDVVAGKANERSEQIRELCERSDNLTFHMNIANMAELMSRADLSLGAGGTTTWERCCLGLPSLTVAVADNQVEVARLSDSIGFGRYLGRTRQVTPEQMVTELQHLISHPTLLAKMSRVAMFLVDGRGTGRVVERLTSQKARAMT